MNQLILSLSTEKKKLKFISICQSLINHFIMSLDTGKKVERTDSMVCLSSNGKFILRLNFHTGLFIKGRKRYTHYVTKIAYWFVLLTKKNIHN